MVEICKIPNVEIEDYVSEGVSDFLMKNSEYLAVPKDKYAVIPQYAVKTLIYNILSRHVLVIEHASSESPIFFLRSGLSWLRLEDVWHVVMHKIHNKMKLDMKPNNVKLYLEDFIIRLNEDVEHKKLPVRQFTTKRYVLFEDGSVWDLKAKKFLDNVQDLYFSSKKNYNFNGKIQRSEYVPIIEDLFSTYANNDEGMCLLLKQLCFSVIEGYGRHTMVLVRSSGGQGKSEFANFLERLGSNVVRINVNQLDNAEYLKRVKPNITAIIGDDMNEKVNLFHQNDSVLKSMIMGNVYSYVPKYETSKSNVFVGLIFQPVNEFPRMYGKEDAITRRLLCLDWLATKEGLDGLKCKHPDILDLMANKDFVQTVREYILLNVDYFDKFNLKDDVLDLVSSTLGENDMIEQHILDLKERHVFTHSELINFSVCYEDFKRFSKLNYPSSRCVSLRTYSKVARRIAIKLDLIFDNEPVSYKTQSLNLERFNPIPFVESDELRRYFANNTNTHSQMIKSLLNMYGKSKGFCISKIYEPTHATLFYNKYIDFLEDKPVKDGDHRLTILGACFDNKKSPSELKIGFIDFAYDVVKQNIQKLT